MLHLYIQHRLFFFINHIHLFYIFSTPASISTSAAIIVQQNIVYAFKEIATHEAAAAAYWGRAGVAACRAA